MRIGWRRVIFTVAVLIALSEIGVRLLGLADVPIRLANQQTGYIPLANQSGRFLRNDWHINGQHMISRREFTAAGQETVLSGDSVVFGGNPLAQDERVAEQLDQLLEDEVYAIADGSWALKNQLNYFMSLPVNLREIERIIFILNSGDFDQASSWRCFSYHPTEAPISHLIFVARKYLYPDCLAQTPVELIVVDYDLKRKVTDFLEAYPQTEVSAFLYQDRRGWRERRSMMRAAEAIFPASQVHLSELIEFADLWEEGYYADGIHPTAQGAAALAHILRRMIAARPNALSGAKLATSAIEGAHLSAPLAAQ